MIRCLVSVYTSKFLYFASIDACILALSDIPVNLGEPLHDFPVLQHSLHKHIPFKASFRSDRRDMLFRNCYNNHCASNPYLSYIQKKSATGIQKSYSIALPHWTPPFVRVIFLAALG